MNIIIDECVPKVVKRRLKNRNIVTVQEMGWSGVKNGQLLRQIVDAAFDVFVTSDKNLRHQQHLQSFDLSIILLPSNQVPIVIELLPDIDSALANVGPKEFIEI